MNEAALKQFSELVDLYDETIALLKHDGHELAKVLLPRRYIPPQGYINPKVHALFMASQLACNQRVGQKLDKTTVDYVMLDWVLCEAGVPTIFVAGDFLEDLMLTDVPGDFKLTDFLWPHEGMVFVLPVEFQRRYFGRYVPFVRIGRVNPQKHAPPKCVSDIIPQANDLGMFVEKPTEFGVFVTATVFFPDANGKLLDSSEGCPRGVDYSASYACDTDIATIIQDTVFETGKSEGIPDDWRILSSPDEDIEIIHKITTLALQVLLAMNAMPEHLEPHRLARPEKVRLDRKGKKTVEKEALWYPHLFGGNYVRDRKPPQGGHHASPHMHRRKGHRRIYRDPLTRQILRWIWIKPCWVGKQLDKKENDETTV